MTTYKGIRGQTIRTIAGDASPLIAGDIWYNSTAKKIRGVKLVAAWSSGGNINQGKQVSFSIGTQTAAMATGGYGGSPAGPLATTEQYDGSSWTEVADLNQARGGIAGGAGTQTAALVAGGDQYPGTRQTAYSETWDNTSWTATPALSTSRSGSGMLGATNTAAIIATGNSGSPSAHTPIAGVESWNGSAWSEVGDVNTARNNGVGTGTSTAGMLVAGNTPPPANVKVVEEWNGTSWTETTDTNIERRAHGSSRGPNTSIIIFGGRSGWPETDNVATTESWDGSSWTEIADLATGRSNVGGAGSGNTSALCWGPAPTTAVEEFSEVATASSFTSS